jgi:hypothetical protein
MESALDDFMKAQDAQNKSINSSLNKLLKLAEASGAKMQDDLPEDKGSNTKGKNTSASYQNPQLRRSEHYRGDPNAQKKSQFCIYLKHCGTQTAYTSSTCISAMVTGWSLRR